MISTLMRDRRGEDRHGWRSKAVLGVSSYKLRMPAASAR